MRYGVVLLFVGFASACNGKDSGQQFSFQVRAAGVERDASQPFVLETSAGWQVSLTQAYISLGPIYFHSAEAEVEEHHDEEQAHDVHDAENVAAEVLAVFTVDALNPSPFLIEQGGKALPQPVSTAEIRLNEAAGGPIAERADPGQALAYVAGAATKDLVSINFEAALRLGQPSEAEGYSYYLSKRIDSIPARFTPSPNAELILRVDPSRWFDHVDFEQAFEGGMAMEALRTGMTNPTGVYFFEWYEF